MQAPAASRRVGYSAAYSIAHTAKQPSRHFGEDVPSLAGQTRVGGAGGGGVGNSPARHLCHVLLVFLNLPSDLRRRELPQWDVDMVMRVID